MTTIFHNLFTAPHGLFLYYDRTPDFTRAPKETCSAEVALMLLAAGFQ